ncbi:MAG TPA: hypothetical protein VGZ89_16420 [Xanthobacteraceae bacterium]|nr:hypothetical protein [Xanthobacteraceae bacterium]
MPILSCIGSGKIGVALDHRGPWAAAWIGAERLTLRANERDHLVEAVLAHEGDMVGKTLMARDAVFGAADRPIQHQTRHHVRVGHRKSGDRRAAHAAADEMRARNRQVLQEPFALRHVMRPADRLDAAAGLAAFAAVKKDASEMRRQMVEQFDLLIDAERRLRFDHRIETAGRIHQ